MMEEEGTSAGSSASKKRNYRRSCVVPTCKNTTRSTPNKIFFSLPRGQDIRQKWCKAMKRDEKKNGPMSSISGSNICEDHFNLEEDLVNYWQFKLMKHVRPRLKKGIVPRLFACQKSPTSVTRCGALKRQRHLTVEEAIRELETRTFEPAASSSALEDVQSDRIEEAQTPEIPYKHKGIQVNIKPLYRSKGINTKILITTQAAVSPIKI